MNGQIGSENANAAAVCGTSGWERTNVGEFDSIFDIATPIGSFLHSYVLTLKLTALPEPFSSPYFILRTTRFSGRPRVGTYECTNNSPFIPRRPGNQEFSYIRTLVSCGLERVDLNRNDRRHRVPWNLNA
jgi:hypothetical protein